MKNDDFFVKIVEADRIQMAIDGPAEILKTERGSAVC